MSGGTVARVLVDSPLPQLDQLFDYTVPERLAGSAAAGVRVRVPLRTGGRIADGWLASPGQTPEMARRQVELYRERCAKHGRSPAAVAIRRDIFVGATPEAAEAVAGPIVKRGYRGFDPAALVWGSVEQVTEKFRARAAMGYTDVIVRHLTDEQADVLGSLQRLAAVREALRST